MPRYYFHVYDELALRDEDGVVFADDAAARSAALADARMMICDEVMKGRLVLHHRIEVEDGAGGRVLTLPFSDAVRIETKAA